MTATRLVSYQDQDTHLTGFLAWDETARQPLPGILLVHGGGGLDDHARGQAERYAALGYAVLAGDMFGEGVAGDRERVMACLMALRDDPAGLARRASAGMAALASCPEAGGCFAAVGFCFGGLTVLTLARRGADLRAVVSMHGSLATREPAEPGAVTAKVLACHGAEDPHVPLTDVVAFAAEMDHAQADWQLTMYGGAVHGFTHSHAVPGAVPGVAYDEHADHRSFEAARALLAEARLASPAL
ncbi:MAG TPA: dienelactone hydrolase family protein [Streptosporangiaceae bacterium]|nr:dienelactone hydrolase family protein [Streptosporangiaceae bacterium]